MMPKGGALGKVETRSQSPGDQALPRRRLRAGQPVRGFSIAHEWAASKGQDISSGHFNGLFRCFVGTNRARTLYPAVIFML